jgi:hypothetical protein
MVAVLANHCNRFCWCYPMVFHMSVSFSWHNVQVFWRAAYSFQGDRKHAQCSSAFSTRKPYVVLCSSCRQALTAFLFICFPLAFPHAEQVFEQGKFSLSEIFFGLVAQFACFSFIHHTEGLCDLFLALKPLQLSDGFEAGDPRLEKCFRRFFFSRAVQFLGMEGTQVRERTKPSRNHAPMWREVNAKMGESLRSQRGALSVFSYEEHGWRVMTHTYIYETF